MMVWAAHAVSHFIGLTMWCVVHNVATSCRFIASAIPAHERSSTQCCTVERLCSLLYARITGHDDDLVMRGLTSITCKHCCMPVAVKPFFITAHGEPWCMYHHRSPLVWRGGVRSHVTSGGTRAHHRGGVRFGAARRVVAPEPSRAGRRGLEPWDTWQR
jgi:hypothetical protein